MSLCSWAGRRVWSEFPRYYTAWGEHSRGAGLRGLRFQAAEGRAVGGRCSSSGDWSGRRILGPHRLRAPGRGVHIGGRRAVLVPEPQGEHPSREGAGSHPF